MSDFIPILLALASAWLFAGNFYVQREALKTTDPLLGAFLSVGSTAVIFWLMTPIFLDTSWFTHPSILYFALAGLVFPAMGQFLQIKAVGMVGPALSSSLGAFLPVFAAVPAVLVFDEPFGFQMAAGFALTVSGLAYAGTLGRKLQLNWPLWAIFLPLGAAAARGFGQPLSKMGLVDIPSPPFATLVQGTVSSLVLLGIVVFTGKARKFKTLERKGTGLFIASGLVNGAGLLCVNLALSKGDITKVAPFVSSAPIWVFLMGWAIFRVEKLTLRHLAVVCLVVTGSVLIVTR